MNKNIAGIIAAILGVLGIILILAGPAFHLLPGNPTLFAGIVCFIIAGAIKSFVKKKKKEEKK